MAHDEAQAAGPTKLVIRNIGLVLSGAMDFPCCSMPSQAAEAHLARGLTAGSSRIIHSYTNECIRMN